MPETNVRFNEFQILVVLFSADAVPETESSPSAEKDSS